MYTILYKETAKGEKGDNPATLRINNLKRISGAWWFESHPHRHTPDLSTSAKVLFIRQHSLYEELKCLSRETGLKSNSQQD
jgi:hypothetical protein